MVVARSEQMQVVAYVLARCGALSPQGGHSGPPEWLGVATWREAYALFYDALGDGRTPTTFANSLKNARDAFDAHVPSGRVGWVDLTGKAHRKDVMVGRVLSEWGGKSDEELRLAVEEILEGAFVEPGADEPDETTAQTEGGVKVYLAKKYERSSKAKRDAIKVHGTSCMGCEFDFGARYGQHGEGYIEVHHAMPLAEHGKRKTDPKSDLLVLCSNCHRMVHRKQGICLSLVELKLKISQAATEAAVSAP